MYSVFRKDLLEVAQSVLGHHKQFEENEISEADVLNHQLKKFSEVIVYVKSGSEFYKRHLRSISEDALNNLTKKEIQKIPFTTKEHLRDAQHDMCSSSLDKAWVYYETTGTTGPSTPCPRNEVDSIVNNTPLVLRYQPILEVHAKKHVVGILGPTELHSTGDTFEDVFRSMGHTVVKMWPRSPVVGNTRALKLIRDLQVTVLICTPAVASELAKNIDEQGFKLEDFGVKLLLVLGELITPSRLKAIGNIWNATAYNCMYASQESSILAVTDQHHELTTVPLNNFYELINPDTGDSLTIDQDMKEGELVITNLYEGQKPLIRYRTGDMVRARTNGSKWVIEPIGRVKDRIKSNQKTLYAYDIEEAIFHEIPDCNEYSLIIESKNQKDIFTIAIDLNKGVFLSHQAISDLEHSLSDQLGITITIKIGGVSDLVGTTAMVSWKAARLFDQRQESTDVERVAALGVVNGRS